MSKYLLDGLPPKVVTYIKVHLRHVYSTGLFDSQEREDLIQDLVLFYLERYYKKDDIPDALLFTAFRTKANHLIRTRLRDLQSGLFTTGSLNSMFEDEGFEPFSDFSLADLESSIEIRELRKFLSPKQNMYIDLILEGKSGEEARAELHIAHSVLKDIESRILRGREKIQKK